MTPDEVRSAVERVGRIDAVPTILDVICRSTGMRFAAVARVTEERWIACGVQDELGFGLSPGGELKLETTICHEIRQSRQAVAIDHVAEEDAWCGHPTPAMYGFQSYVSVPIILADGSMFGTLCAIDPRPARVNTPETLGMFRLFADLIAKNLDSIQRLAAAEEALREERAIAELREQFIAVLGHDLRTPMRAIHCFAEILAKKAPADDETVQVTRYIRESASRMVLLIENLLDFARGRLGGGLPLNRNADEALEPVLRAVIGELSASHPGRVVETEIRLAGLTDCDRPRVAQLLSNLLGNALSYGAEDRPVRVRAIGAGGALEVTVANEGTPIPVAALPRLFHPFYRSAVMQNREGLGLGLYIAHEIAKAHGGELEVSSTEEETRFTFRMPAGGAGA